MKQEIEQLKPCPFCGWPPFAIDIPSPEWDPNSKWKAIGCGTLGCPGAQIRVRYDAEDEVSKVCAWQEWNTRHRIKKRIMELEEKENAELS